jgi:hypothetical protein
MGEYYISDAVKVALQIRDLKLAAVKNDIEWYPMMLYFFEEEKASN